MAAYDIKPNYRALSRKYSLDRRTVAKYHKNNGKASKTRKNRESKYDVHKDLIIEKASISTITIQACSKYFEKKFLDIVWNYLSFKPYIRKLGIFKRKQHQEAHLRYETVPGEQIQYDWKESMTMTTRYGEVISFNIFTATLGYSRFHSFVYLKSRTKEDFIRCKIEVLNKLAGSPRVALTDNMSSIISLTGGRRVKHEIIRKFEADTGIEIRLCKVKTPETTGKVESANRFISWLKPYDGEFKDEAELISILNGINNQVNQKVNETTGVPLVVLFEKEKEYLSHLPRKALLDTYISDVKTQIVPQTLLVSYKGNQYSMPNSYLNKRDKIVPIDNKLYLYYNTHLIAIHDISSNKFNYQKGHYTEVLSTKIRK